jgi:hypothetical protein
MGSARRAKRDSARGFGTGKLLRLRTVRPGGKIDCFIPSRRRSSCFRSRWPVAPFAGLSPEVLRGAATTREGGVAAAWTAGIWTGSGATPINVQFRKAQRVRCTRYTYRYPGSRPSVRPPPSRLRPLPQSSGSGWSRKMSKNLRGSRSSPLLPEDVRSRAQRFSSGSWRLARRPREDFPMPIRSIPSAKWAPGLLNSSWEPGPWRLRASSMRA